MGVVGMDANQVRLVQSSFEKVAPLAEAAASMFYGRLFEIAPRVRPLFKGDTTEQGRKLMATLAFVVKNLSDLDTVVPAAKSLATRHVGYGVTAEDYQPVGEALLWTLERSLPGEFTSETKAAWLAAYSTISKVMMVEAYGEAARAVNTEI